MGSEAGVLLLQVHEGLLGCGGLLRALLHQALHAGQCTASISHAALQRLRWQAIVGTVTLGLLPDKGSGGTACSLDRLGVGFAPGNACMLVLCLDHAVLWQQCVAYSF